MQLREDCWLWTYEASLPPAHCFLCPKTSLWVQRSDHFRTSYRSYGSLSLVNLMVVEWWQRFLLSTLCWYLGSIVFEGLHLLPRPDDAFLPLFDWFFSYFLTSYSRALHVTDQANSGGACIPLRQDMWLLSSTSLCTPCLILFFHCTVSSIRQDRLAWLVAHH